MDGCEYGAYSGFPQVEAVGSEEEKSCVEDQEGTGAGKEARGRSVSGVVRRCRELKGKRSGTERTIGDMFELDRWMWVWMMMMVVV